jgi:hypothetical protein
VATFFVFIFSSVSFASVFNQSAPLFDESMYRWPAIYQLLQKFALVTQASYSSPNLTIVQMRIENIIQNINPNIIQIYQALLKWVQNWIPFLLDSIIHPLKWYVVLLVMIDYSTKYLNTFDTFGKVVNNIF